MHGSCSRPGFSGTAFFEKATGPPAKNTYLINGGLYFVQRRLRGYIPSGSAVSLEKEVFPALEPTDLRAFVTDGFCIDIGIPEDFHRAQVELPRRFLP